jgi:tetratricopeptide (TPR) repeat protein
VVAVNAIFLSDYGMFRLSCCLTPFMKFAPLALATCLLVSAGIAQNAPIGPAPSQQKQSQSSRQADKPARDFSGEPIIYESVHAKMRFENDGTGVREVTARIRVQTAAGLSKAGQLILDYNAANEHLEIRSVKVIKPDSTAVVAGPEAVQDLSAPVAREAPMYTDARQKHVTVPSLAVGDAVEYDAVTTSSPLQAGQFWQTWNFISDAICLDEQVELDVPGDRTLKLKSPIGVEPTVREEAGRRIYHWSTSTLEYRKLGNLTKAMKFDIKAMLEGLHPAPPRQILLSTLQSWADVGRWYAGLEHDRRIVTPEIRAKADEIVQGRNNEREKAEALYAWVSRNVRYVSLSFGVGRYQPHAAAEVLQNRYGDCKDKATLLEALFEAEGLHAQAVLINSRMKVDPDVPSPLQFDHAITFLGLGGHDTWLDSTLPVGPFAYLLPQLRGKEALVVSTDTPPRLEKSPESLPVLTLYKATVDGKVDAEKNFDAKIGLDTRGDLEVLIRTAVMQLPAGQITALMEQGAAVASKSSDSEFNISDFRTGDPTDTSKPFHVEVHVHTKWKESPSKPETASPEQIAAEIGSAFTGKDGLLSILPGVETKPNAAGKLEQQAIALGGPKEYVLEVSLNLPDLEKTGDQKPWHVHITKDIAEYESSLIWDDHTLRGSLRLNLRVPEVPASQAKEYAAFLQQVVESFRPSGSPASAEKKPSMAPPAAKESEPLAKHVTTPEAAAFFKQGEDAAHRGDWANAERAFDSASKLDSAYPEAWRELGRSRMALSKWADGESAFRKFLELAPEDSQAYGNVAWALNAQKKYDDSVALLTKRVASNPDDAMSHLALGHTYYLMHKPEKSVPELETATSLLPNYRPARYSLAQAYLQLHDYDRAAGSFEKAIALDGSALTMNDAAYQIALTNTHLDLAEKWSVDAVRAVELELNQINLPLRAQTMYRANQVSAYWDTLGWIKFLKSDLPGAEKYIFAATQLTGNSTEVFHLGKIYEAQGRKNEAIEAYAEAVALVPATREMDDDEKEAKTRLLALLGGDTLLDSRVKQARSTMTVRRSVSIPNSNGSFGFSQFMLIIGPGSKVADIATFTPDDPLADMKEAVRAATMPQTLPDDVLQKLPRMGTLSCPSADQPCTFALMPAVAASQVVAPAPLASSVQ